MRVAYLVNQYPKVSHTFIRREIRALESLGATIDRISIRVCNEPLVDRDDLQECEQTFVVLNGNLISLIWPTLRLLVVHPIAFCRATRLAIKLGRRAPRALWRHLAYLAEAALLCTRFSHRGIQHIHAHFGTNSTTVALLWNALGGPGFSFTVHGPEEFDKPESLGLDVKIARARFVVAISEFGRSQLMRWCGHRDWEKLHVVHCGVDERFLERRPSNVPDNRRLVCVGRLCEQKGHGVLIAAAAQLASEGVEFELVLVGDGPLRSEIESSLTRHSLAEKVRITGWMSGPEVASELAAARALVLPSFAEGLPVVIMEALAMGRPVISTYVAGIPELVEPGVCGWLVPAGAMGALCDSMRAALETPVAQLTQMGRMGAMRVSCQHGALKEAEKLRALVQQSIVSTASILTEFY
jgi:colanic acid/amylovoran biosynthesis glycosyltransferase